MARPKQESPIFRQEALEHYMRNRLPGDLLRVSPIWARLSFWALILVFCGGIAYGLLASINEYAVGPGVVDVSGDEVVALLPAQQRPDLEEGMGLRFESELGEWEFEISSIEEEPLDPSDAQERLGVPLPPAPAVVGPVILVHAEPLPGSSLPDEAIAGRAEVRVESDRVLFALVPGLKEIFGADG